MRYCQLGESGLTVSVIGLGGNNFGSRIGLEERAAWSMLPSTAV